jgi:diacylglycerol kinase family enzyme
MNSDHDLAAKALQGRLIAVLNTHSGRCDQTSAAEIRAIFDKAGLHTAEILTAGGPELDGVLERAAGSADVLVILGGDGTVRTAVEKLRGRNGYLVPLPGGTMNMLPRALYGETAWQLALTDTLAAPEIHPVSGGRLGPHSFFVAALLGAPTLWADAREAVREGELVVAARRAVTAARRGFGEPLKYVFDGVVSGSAEAVAVICPLISKVMSEDEGMLEAAAIDTAGAADALRLGFHALFDDWRADPAVTRAKVKTATVTGHGRVPVIADGERVRMGRSVTVEYVPVAFRALAPAKSEPKFSTNTA